MALPASGPIRFSDLRTEFSGNAGSISISDYRASYEADARTKVFVAQIVDSTAANIVYAISRNSTFLRSPEDDPNHILSTSLYLSPGQTLFAWGTSLANRPVYLSSSPTANGPAPAGNIVAGSNPFNTGVTTPLANNWFVKWDTTGITVSGDDPGVIGYLYSELNDVALTIYQVPRPQEKVFRIPSKITMSWSSTFQGGNTSTLANNVDSGGTYFDTKSTNGNRPSLLAPGKTISVEITSEAFVNVRASGTYIYSYFPIYPTTGNVSAASYDAGKRGTLTESVVFVRWGSNQGGAGNYIGGAGQPNTPAGVATVLAATAPSGGVAPGYTSNASHTGFTLQTSTSGGKVTFAITNTSGNTYWINNWTTLGTGGNATPVTLYWQGSDDVFRYTIDVMSDYSFPVQTQIYGMPYAPGFNQTYISEGQTSKVTGFYVTGSDAANADTYAQDFVNYTTDDFYWRWQRNLRAVGNVVEIYPAVAANSYELIANTDAGGNLYATNYQSVYNTAYGTTDPEITFTVAANPGNATVGFWNQDIPMRQNNVSLSSYYNGNSSPYSFT